MGRVNAAELECTTLERGDTEFIGISVAGRSRSHLRPGDGNRFLR